MPNRTEILHFRVTPEEKEKIVRRMQDSEIVEDLSAFLRDQALFGVSFSSVVQEEASQVKRSPLDIPRHFQG